MKKFILLFTVLACFVFKVNAQVQDNVIKFNIFSPIVKTFNFSYERVLSDKSSLQLGIAIVGTKITDTKFSGVRITPEYRMYLSDEEAPTGLYLAPFARYSTLTLTSPSFSGTGDDEADFNTVGLGLVIGQQWLFGSNENVAFDIFIGPSYNSGSVKVKSGNEDSFDIGSFDGFGLRFGVNFGFGF